MLLSGFYLPFVQLELFLFFFAVMEIGNLWLIPVSIFLNSSLYWVQKHYLIKWFCRKFLSGSVQLECDLPPKKEGIANGTVADSTSNGQLPAEKYDSDKSTTYNGKKVVTDGEINGVAME